MRVLYILIVYFTLLLGDACAQTIQSEFLPTTKIAKIKEGDIIEATLRFWPIENADLEQFKVLEKTMFFNSFYLAKIIGVGVSPNNADVVEMKGLFVVKSAKSQVFQNIKYNNTIIDVDLGDVTIEALNDKSEDYYVLDQSLSSSNLWMILTGILALILLVIFIKRKAIKDFIIKLKPDAEKKLRKKYSDLFRKAKDREDFELIYREKNLWLPLLEVVAPAHREFFKILNQYQFKKEWTEEESSEVKNSFDIIRRSF